MIRWASEPRDGIEAHTLDAEGRTCAALGIREETGWDRGLSQANASALAVAEDGLRRLALH